VLVLSSCAVNAFFSARKQEWHREPRQRIWRCLDHLLHYIAHMVETNASKMNATVSSPYAQDLTVSNQEARAFMRMSNDRDGMLPQRQSAMERKRRVGEDGELIENEFLESFEGVRAKLIGKVRCRTLGLELRPEQSGSCGTTAARAVLARSAQHLLPAVLPPD
jgi:hypothetical protein